MGEISGIYTVNQIAQEISEAYGSSDSTSLDKAYRCISRAIRIISRKGEWPFFRLEDQTLVTASTVENYKIKSGIRLPRYIHMRDPAIKLKMIDLRVLRRLYPNNTVLTGTPRFWRIVSFDPNALTYKIGLWPIPDGEYTLYIDAEQNPPLPSDPNDDIRQTGLPEEMIETVINLGIALMYEKYDTEKYTQKMTQAMAMLDDDYYRLGNNADEDLTSREFDGMRWTRLDDPQFGPQYD